MTELSVSGYSNKNIHYGLTFTMCAVLLVTIIMNGLAGSGTAPFNGSVGDISNKYAVCIVPASYTFSIWSLIYPTLVIMAIYGVTALFSKVGATPVWQLGGFMSVPFMAAFTINMVLSVAWLFAWDSEAMIASAVLLLLTQIASNIAVTIGAIAFDKSGTRLYEASKFHFWANIVALNIYNIYDVWLILAAQVNLMMTLNYEIDDVEESTLCLIFLSVVLGLFIIYFLMEHTCFRRLCNPFLTHYMTYLWAIVGIWTRNQDFENADVHNMLITNIFFASFFVVVRCISIYVFNKNNPYYSRK